MDIWDNGLFWLGIGCFMGNGHDFYCCVFCFGLRISQPFFILAFAQRSTRGSAMKAGKDTTKRGKASQTSTNERTKMARRRLACERACLSCWFPPAVSGEGERASRLRLMNLRSLSFLYLTLSLRVCLRAWLLALPHGCTAQIDIYQPCLLYLRS